MYTLKNFHKHTYCEFQEVNFDFSEVETFTSKSGSVYHYTLHGVYRYSNHWGRVADCRWKLTKVNCYKNQKWYTGYAEWSSFYDLNSYEKRCFLTVDTNSKKVIINVGIQKDVFLVTIKKALQRKKEIETIFKNNKFLKYYQNPKEVERQVIHQLINSGKSLEQIKLEL